MAAQATASYLQTWYYEAELNAAGEAAVLGHPVGQAVGTLVRISKRAHTLPITAGLEIGGPASNEEEDMMINSVR